MAAILIQVPDIGSFYPPEQAKRQIGWVFFAAIFGLAVLLFFSVIRASMFSEVEAGSRIWFDIVFLLFAAILAEFLVLYLRQPTVMVLMIVGILISPSAISAAWPYLSGSLNFLLGLVSLASFFPDNMPHLVSPEGAVETFAQLGALVLLFKIGLHSKISQIFNRQNFLVAFLGIIFPFAAGFLYASLGGHSFAYSMFLGAALTATSVGVTVAILDEFHVLDKQFAKILIGAAVIDDILALLVLSVVVNFPSDFSVSALSPLAGVLFSAAIFISGGILLGKYIVDRFIDLQAEGEVLPKKTFLSVMVFFLLYAYTAEFIGLSGIVGAFLAGLVLSRSKICKRIEEFILPLELLFTPIFFISLGMFVDVNALSQFFIPILAISAIAVITKVMGCGLSALALGLKRTEAALVGFGMSPRGEIALIIGLFGLSSGVLSNAEYSIIASMAFLTTIITPPILKRLMKRKN
ncbi:hypothetical protein COV61_02430 [Candidatus Micrarchaeota archaeon CG11_big_fil_rev_8_21_14_0_20_47_5]|nr:MAG: hypothetical protein AUJ17_01150 [Candidatus Micrarchaeota archaeon CG1_02_47_40]PIN83674.1 MAG: hypothetical protein COV61_02430 [Candidatus Micrarchaeota archaeon CG11_big_fil_rev_8_21_14_0_20_47_5]